ncbi:MAG: C_GCAxxG_C_C family protein [Clostridia bacterium]|nr:C_GCAxxG_C_C family protein [Clostridia bacterium]
MTAHEEEARRLFYQGCNCSQAVFAAFCDVTGLEEETALKMSASFGGGFGRMREVCGAVCGMTLAYSCLYGYSDLSEPGPKIENYKAVSRMMNRFAEEMGSYVCRDILKIRNFTYDPVPKPRTEEFYNTRPCLKCVMAAARILDEEIAARDVKT